MTRALAVVALVAGTAACGSDATGSGAGADDGSVSAERPRVVVTTNVLGDVVSTALGSQVEVEVIMPLGADPHDFAPSARQAESMEDADLLVVNGAGFEEGMLDVIANVSDTGTPIFSFADQVDLLEFDGHGDHADEDRGDEDHGDEDHADEDHADEEGGEGDHADEGDADEDHADGDHADEDHADEEGGEDPHLWTDPIRVATAVEALEPIVVQFAGVDADAVSASVDAYVVELESLDASITEELAPIPDERRVLVTNHEVFGYFADRYDFEVVGAIVPSLTTNAEPSASDIEELAAVIQAEGISAVFGETTQSTQLADALADEVGGDVVVVALFSESLGASGSGAETYLDMMSANADLIAAALAP